MDSGGAAAPAPLCLGVTLEDLCAFVADAGDLRGMTSAAVGERIIRPRAEGVSFCAQHRHSCRPATIFVCHHDQGLFLDLVASLKHWVSKDPEWRERESFWIDLFSPHAVRPILPQSVLVLTWPDMALLRHKTLELASTLEAGSRWELAFAPAGDDEFLWKLELDVEYVDECIVRAVAEAPCECLRRASQAVSSAMRTCLLEEASRMMHQYSASRGRRRTLAVLLMCHGEYDEAEDLFRELLEDPSYDVNFNFRVVDGLASLLRRQGRRAEADQLYHDMIEQDLPLEDVRVQPLVTNLRVITDHLQDMDGPLDW